MTARGAAISGPSGDLTRGTSQARTIILLAIAYVVAVSGLRSFDRAFGAHKKVTTVMLKLTDAEARERDVRCDAGGLA